MQHENQLYLSNDFPQYEDLGVKSPRRGVIVSMCKADNRGGVFLPSSNRMLPDVGTVISVGEKYGSDKKDCSIEFRPGDKVAVRPGIGLYFYDYEGSGHDLRFIQDIEDEDEDIYQYVLDAVPVKLTENGVSPVSMWLLAQQESKKTDVVLASDIGDGFSINGKKIVKTESEPLTFRNPEDWGLNEQDCLVLASSVVAWVS